MRYIVITIGAKKVLIFDFYFHQLYPEIFIETPRLILRQWNETDHKPYIGLKPRQGCYGVFPICFNGRPKHWRK